MSLSIATNVNALRAQRNAFVQEQGLARSIQRLSSGLRINGAADDAAGLAIAGRMTAGIRGANQAVRNINDSLSLLQVADGAMGNVSESLQRLRELAVQAGNGANSASDIASLQQEASQILSGITDIGKQTSFNGDAVFSQDTASIGGDPAKRAVLDGLQSGWLNEAERLVQTYYGLTADGAPLTVDLDSFTDGRFNVLAFVSGNISGGKYTDIYLTLDMADFQPPNLPDGGSAPLYDDRIIAHEMTHAVMSRTMNFASLPLWFVEGTAELIQGGDERLRNVIASDGVASVVNSVGSGFSYEGSYAASRYLHAKLKDMGVPGGIKGIMQYLNQHQSANLDEALNAVTDGAYATTADFVADFTANGADYIANSMNLTNADTGAIGGLDADGGSVRTAKNVLTDIGDRAPPDVLAGFEEHFPTLGGGTGTKQYDLQVGANAGDRISVNMAAMNAAALGIADLDLKQGSIALMHIDQALSFVTSQRVNVGASTSRLEAAASNLGVNAENLTASRSRIQDADYAAETATLTHTQILQQAATAMVAQANALPQAILSLIR